jgi:L-lactate dehydrogenase
MMSSNAAALTSKGIRIAIVGVGNVGASYAFALLLNRLCSEIVLIDSNHAKAEGEAMDLNHAVPFAHPTRIWAGDFADCAGAAITVIAAGSGQKPGETRLDMVVRNGQIWRQIVPQVVKHNPGGILLIATNPVDVLTYAALKLSGLPANRVIGSGTILDTARFRYLLSEHFKVDARSVHAFIIGEHGDSEVPVWSLANIAGMKLEEFGQIEGEPISTAVMRDIYERTRDAAYHIIERKGATYYAVAAGLIQITAAIVRDQNTIFSVSTWIDEYAGIRDVCFSLPAVLNSSGVARVLPLPLNAAETEQLRKSAQVLKETIEKLGL